MMIRVKSTSAGPDVMVQVSIGRKGNNASDDLQDRSTICMTAREWMLFKRTLERGAVRPVIVVIEEVESSDPQPIDDDTAKEASPF